MHELLLLMKGAEVTNEKARSTPQRRGFYSGATLLLASILALTFGNTVHAQTTGLSAELDKTSNMLTVHLDAGEPLERPLLSIMFSPGVSATDTPMACLDPWRVETVRLADADAAEIWGAGTLESQRFSCTLGKVAERDTVDLIIPIEILESASELPVSATVSIASGSIVLNTSVIQSITPDRESAPDVTVCDPAGVPVAPEAPRLHTPSPAIGTVSGTVSIESSGTLPMVELFGIDSCNQWIVRNVRAAPDGTFAFAALLPGKFAVTVRDSAAITAVALERDHMKVEGVML